jgi:hypothetical protein
MALSLEKMEDDYFTAVDDLLAVSFIRGDVDDVQLYRGPSFGVWALRDQWDGVISPQSAVFINTDGKSLFYFAQKKVHMLALDDVAIAVTTTCQGRPIYANEIGKRDALTKLLEAIDIRFNDEYTTRFVPASRGRDALAVSGNEEHHFILLSQNLRGSMETLTLEAFISFAELS